MAAPYSVLIKRSAEKEIRDLPEPYRSSIIEAIRALAIDPRPPGCQKLSGRDAWRIRVGVYRVVYSIDDQQLIVVIVRVAHRREAYR